MNYHYLFALLFTLSFSAHAQESTNAGGSTATGSGGSAAFTVGEVVYSTANGADGSAVQGVQQAYIPSDPLPVYFKSFTGKCVDSQTKLTWETTTETNNAYFEVEKSQDARQWRTLTKINGALNSNETMRYTYTDTEKSEGNSYYRIKQTDSNGRTSRTNSITVVGCGGSLQMISVYPNPTSDGINIRIVAKDKVGYELYDIRGIRLGSGTLSELTYLPMEKLVPSAYVLKVTTLTNEVTSFTIIKN